jgi:FkbM family methyltransferase
MKRQATGLGQRTRDAIPPRAPWRIETIAGHSFFPSLLHAGSSVVDLGMNRGDFAVTLVERFDCRVVGVEPDERVLPTFPVPARLSIEHAAVGSHDGLAYLLFAPGLDATVRPELAPPGVDGEEVTSLTLKTIAQRHGLARIDLLKVDIEGAEIETLLAAPADILQNVVQLSVEFHDWMNVELLHGTNEVDRRLRKLGFNKLQFSWNRSDVLYINRSLAPLSTLVRAWVVLRYRYARGARRVAGRTLAC